MGGVSGTPSRNTHVFSVQEESVWVGVQFYCNGYLFEDCSVHDIDVKYCYDDAVAICGGWGGVSGAAGVVDRIQVYNIRGEKTGQLGGMVKIDGGDTQSSGNAVVSDISVRNVTGYTNGVNESLISQFKGGAANSKKIILAQLQSKGKWAYGVYAQTNGNNLIIDGFQLEALNDIQLQGNRSPSVNQRVSITNGSGQSRNASLADTIEGSGLLLSAGTGSQGFQNIFVDNVSFRNKLIPINEGTTIPAGAGTQGTYSNTYYSVDVRNSATSDCDFSSTSRRARFFKEGEYVSEDAPVLTAPLPVSSGGTGSATQNFVDLSSNQTILGDKIFSNDVAVPDEAYRSGWNGSLKVPTKNAVYDKFETIFAFPSLTAGSVLFSDGTTIAQDNPNLYWDNTNKRLGIGTASPQQALHVSSGNTYQGILINGNAAPSIGFARSTTTTPEWKVGVSGNTGTSFAISSGASGADKLVIDSAGNVGIGITAPKSKLHVEGASGWIIADEQDADPTTTQLDANDSIAIYNKSNKLVFAYNNAGTMTYLSLPLDGSSTTWTHSTVAP